MDAKSQHLIIVGVFLLGLVALLGTIHTQTASLHDIALAVVSGLCGALCGRQLSNAESSARPTSIPDPAPTQPKEIPANVSI